MDEIIKRWKKGIIDEYFKMCQLEWMGIGEDGLVEGRFRSGQMNQWMGVWMDGWVAGRMNEWINAWMGL